MRLVKFMLFASGFFMIPVLFAWLQDIPSRFLLKEFFSLLAIGAFHLAIGQAFLVKFFRQVKLSELGLCHKPVGYAVMVIMLLHPLFIIMPRFFLNELSPLSCLSEMIESPRLATGICAWLTLLTLALLSIFKNRLHFGKSMWIRMHTVISIIFYILAFHHMVRIGRHSNIAVNFLTSGFIFFILLRAAMNEFKINTENPKLKEES
ncbi:MAG: ferric reductase-like transmembrane domain-containing protein [Oligoflexales bacterium]|nr:ferric reductase-like transmembrane domain-containing protein [Oligoflexales bacterium]